MAQEYEQQYLMLPGPTPVPPRILRALSAPMMNHRGPEFKLLLERVTEGIKKVYKTENDIAILTTSGTGAMEAAVVNFISPGDRVLAVSIGVFGDRFATIAERYGAIVDRISFPMGQAADPDAVGEMMRGDKGKEIKAVLVTHNETSTGVVNDIRALRQAVGDHPALFIVDAVSGLGAMEFRMDEWNVDVAVSASQKAFMLPPGLAFVAASRRALEVGKEARSPRYYLDIREYQKYRDKGQTPYTPAISLFYGLAEALDMIEEETIEGVVSRHQRYRDMVRAGARALGLNLLAGDDVASSAVTSVVAPEKVGANHLRKHILDKYQVALAGGQQHLDNVIFRIGHLGAVRELDLLAVLAALEMALCDLGVDVTLGSAVKAAQEVMMKKTR